VPAGLIALVNALQDENHWLRQREHAELFDRNLKDASRLRGCAIKYKGYMAGTVDVEDYDSDGMGFSRNDIVAEALFSSAHVEQLFDTFQPRTGQRAALGPKKSPSKRRKGILRWSWKGSVRSLCEETVFCIRACLGRRLVLSVCLVWLVYCDNVVGNTSGALNCSIATAFGCFRVLYPLGTFRLVT
jgi:hypothetical protein